MCVKAHRGSAATGPARASTALTVSSQEGPVSSEALLLTHELSSTAANASFMNHHALLISGKILSGILGEQTQFLPLGGQSIFHSDLKSSS